MQKRFFSHFLLLSVLMAHPLLIQPTTQTIDSQYLGYVAVADLEPQSVWRYFAEISQIPRGSYHEDIIARKVMGSLDASRNICSTSRPIATREIVANSPLNSPRLTNSIELDIFSNIHG